MDKIIDKIKKHQKAILLVVLLVLVIVGVSYAWLKVTLEGKRNISIEGDQLDIILKEQDSDLELVSKFPITDEEGRKGKEFTFYIQNNSRVNVTYDLKLIDNEEKQKECGDCEFIPYNDIRYELKKVEDVEVVDGLKEDRIIDSGYLRMGEENKVEYTLKIWLDINAGTEAQGKTFYGKVVVHAVQEPKSGVPNDPVLADNMIPVVYDTTDKRWEKADTTKSWYNYDKQEWANAVTVTNDTRGMYQNNVPGTEVKMDHILQMWVWIPRYSYTIKDTYGKGGDSTANPGEIDVSFIKKEVKETGTAQYTGEKTYGWYTPPGFTFGEEELPGIWVGKFETGYSSGEGTGVGAVSTEAAQSDTEEPNKAIIKPNVYSWRNIRVSTLDLVSRKMVESGNVFGFDQSTYDAHAIKDSEWALISYLTQSKYGKYGNSLYTGANKEVYMNNYNGYMTGCSSGVPSAGSTDACGNAYDVMVDRGGGQGYAGAGSSSTGNITGIYDINGGPWEYTMGVLNKMSGNTDNDNSGYSGTLTDDSYFAGRAWPDEKYYDLYTSNDPKTACNGNPCKGHALNEVAGWYNDSTNMVSTMKPWSARSGHHNGAAYAGAFYYSSVYGSAYAIGSFRQVLAPVKNS